GPYTSDPGIACGNARGEQAGLTLPVDADLKANTFFGNCITWPIFNPRDPPVPWSDADKRDGKWQWNTAYSCTKARHRVAGILQTTGAPYGRRSSRRRMYDSFLQGSPIQLTFRILRSATN